MIDNPNDLTEQVQNLAERTAQVASDHLARILALTTDFEEFKKTASGRTLKQLVWTALPVNDAGLHLVDGSELYAGGVYDGFVTDVARLESSYPDAFVTQEQWDDSVNTYGSCGKFVVRRDGGSVVSVRLPKVSDILQGTTDLSAVGDLVEAGLPNITGAFKSADGGDRWLSQAADGAFQTDSSVKEISPPTLNTSATKVNRSRSIQFSAFRSSPIYRDDINTVQPQTIKSLLYICVATSIKTPVEVNIDNIATDLNNKADKDFANVTKPYVVEEFVDGTEWYRIWSTGWVEQGGYATAQGNNARVSLAIELTEIKAISLLKNLGNTDYASSTATATANMDAVVWRSCSINRPSGTGFYINVGASATGQYASFWEVKGYKK